MKNKDGENSTVIERLVKRCEKIQNTVKLGYNEHSVVNEHSVITNRFLSQIGKLSTQINPVITNPGYNEQKWPVPSCSL
jgi:hypothetical protein